VNPRRRLAIAGATLLAGGAALAGCAGPPRIPPPPEPVPAPRVRIGDRWRYAQIDLYRRTVTTELAMEAVALEPLLRIRVTDAAGTPRPEETYAAPWRVLQEPAYDEVQVFREPKPLLAEPIARGARTRIVTTYHRPGAERGYFWSDWMVGVAWERIRVPAGEFDALKVVHTIAFDHTDLFRSFCTRDDLLWYAPAVNRWVRREWTGTYRTSGGRRSMLREDWVAWELLEYRPAA
jgi:hypothetical protein